MRSLSLPILIGLVVLTFAPVAMAQQPDAKGIEARITHLVSLGTEHGEVLSRTLISPNMAERGERVYVSELRRRAPGAGLNEWQTLARFSRPIKAVADLGSGDLVVLLDPAMIRGDTPATSPTTRPAASELRQLSVAATLSPISDPRYDPRAVPSESRLPPLPGDAEPLDIAAITIDGAERSLFVLASDGVIYQQSNDRGTPWINVAKIPDGFSVDTADLADAGSLAMAAKNSEGVTVVILDGEGWQELGSIDAERFALVDGYVLRAGGPLLFTSGDKGEALVRFVGGAPEIVTVQWQPAEGEVDWFAAARTDMGDPIAGSFAIGAIRLMRAFTPEKPTASEPGVILVSVRNPATLEARQPGVTPLVRVDETSSRRVMDVFSVVVWGLLVLAFLGMLRQPGRPGPEGVVGGANAIAPPGLRGAAAMVDLLPLIFAFSLYLIAGDRLSQIAQWLIFAASGLTYILVPLISEVIAGRSPGKAIFGLRVVDAVTGEPPRLKAAIVRNVVRPLDLCGGILLANFTPKAQRIGDLLAGTVVVAAVQTPPADENDSDEPSS